MLEDYVEELRSVRETLRKLARCETASASISAGGITKTYSSRDVSALTKREGELVSLIAEIYRGGGLSISMPIYC